MSSQGCTPSLSDLLSELVGCYAFQADTNKQKAEAEIEQVKKMAAQGIEKAEKEAVESSQEKLQDMEKQLDEMKNKVIIIK